MRRNEQSGWTDHRAARRGRTIAAVLAATSLAAGAAVVSTALDAGAAGASTAAGTTAADAAASCWEIKQLHPESTDGVYWLRNTSLERPQEFYCDMTTDGGGWVLIGRGREGWTFRDYGQSTAERVAGDVDGSAAFSPAALSSETIDDLLDGGAVKDLADGVRLRRATNESGSSWQELRWNFQDLTSWSWALGGGHRLGSFTIDGVTGTGSNTKDSTVRMDGETGSGNRNASNYNAWFTFAWSGHGRQAGFSFGGSVDGENNGSSYLWEYSRENRALPFTQVFIRPQLVTPELAPIPDEGTAAQELTPMLDDRPAEIAGGVSGVLKLGDSEPSLDTPVLALTTLGDRVYVGGKFRQVRDTATGGLVDHPFLAAFDRSTGAWISSFDPEVDGTVWDLDVAGGRLIVAGQFTNVDGQPGTSALTALDPVTGAVDPTWRASMTVGGTSARPLARSIDVEGDWIYVGGNFTQIAGATRTLAEGRLGRVAVANGDPDGAFRPNVHGIPYDVDAANGLVQFAGYTSGVNGTDRVGVGTVRAADGSTVTGLADPVWTTSDKRYQQAVMTVGDEVWQGGSEHNIHVYDESTYGLEKAYVTANQGGDTQAFSLAGNTVFQGSHANAWIYEDGVDWQSYDNYSRVDIYNWIGAFDRTTHAYQRDWVPGLRSAYTEGAWALHTDADGCLWFGGDFLGGPYVGGQRQYLEGFSKFCPRDTTAPTVPTNAIATADPDGGVRLRWSHSTDDFPGYIGYEVLRNDRVVSPLVYGSNFVDPSGDASDRYFVRAVDPAGNRSASTTVLEPADNLPPTTPGDLQARVLDDKSVDLTWTASTDDIIVDSYRVLRNGDEVALVPGTETTTNISGLVRGTHWFQLQAIDNAGNESYKTPSVRVDLDGDDVSAPSVPTDLAAVADQATGLITVTWTASTDDVGVESYTVYRNGEAVATTTGDETTAQLDLGSGDHHIQVAALDAAGNASARTPSVLASIIPPDESAPSVPTDLTAVADQATGLITVTWTASTDETGVESYTVYRNGEIVATTAADVTSVELDLGAGEHHIQVSATDTLGHTSAMTPSVLASIVPPDTSNPSTPRDLTAVAAADGSIDVAWTASSDNVGVASYRITRNGAEVLVVSGGETSANVTGLGNGNHYIQVQAFDAAGNSSYRTPSVLVTVVPPPSADTSNPSTPRDVTAVVQPDGTVTVGWSASRDNVGVTSYRVTRNGAEVAVVPGTETSAVVAGLGAGTHYIQLQAFDAAGNSSWRTASVVVTI